MNTNTEYVVEFEYGWQEEPEVITITAPQIDGFLDVDGNELRRSIAFYLAFCRAQAAENAFSDVSSQVFTTEEYKKALEERAEEQLEAAVEVSNG